MTEIAQKRWRLLKREVSEEVVRTNAIFWFRLPSHFHRMAEAETMPCSMLTTAHFSPNHSS